MQRTARFLQRTGRNGIYLASGCTGRLTQGYLRVWEQATGWRCFANWYGELKDISKADTEVQIKITDNYRAPYLKTYLRGLRKYHFHDTSENSSFSQYSHIENGVCYFYEDGRNLAAFMFHIHETDKIVYHHRIIRNIQSIAPYFLDFYFPSNKEPT